MKIGLLTGPIAYPHVVREKQDGQSPHQDSSNRNPKQNSKDSDPNDDSNRQADPESIDRAIADFLADKQTQENGLSANVTGSGPGLKVVLTDGSGGVVRRLTGEEFLKLRQSVSEGTSQESRGKILDQKL